MKKQCKVRPQIRVVPPSNHKPPHGHTRKRLGELAELAFMSKAASLGFGVAKPYGDSERFDFIVSWNRRLWRVQVKSTRTAHRGVYEIGAHGCWGGVDIYTKDDCLHPNVPRRPCYKYEKYREAWWLLKSDPQSERTCRADTPVRL